MTPRMCRFTRVFPSKMNMKINLDIEREARNNFQRATHAQEYLEHLDYCMHFLHVQQRGTTSFHERAQTSAFSPKFEHTFPTRCSAKRDIKQHADLYGKTRVKRTTERAALCVYAVFLRISSKSA